MIESHSDGPTQDLSETVVTFASSPVETGSSQDPGQIGRYRILKVLGKGGYGIVYLAFDEKLERQVAVKVPHQNLFSHPEAAEKYLTEARTVANLDHPHIVPVYDVGSTDECPWFIVSKFINGMDLAAKLKQARLTFTRSAELVATVADALQYAHQQGLVHCDVKPGNIFLDENETPWLADFGLALREQDVSYAKVYVGTTFYMSPEQASGEGHRVDARSDIFSLGIVLYELLAGQRPFVGGSTNEVLGRIIHDDARPLCQHDKTLPRELERICQKAMAKRVSERYSSAINFAEDLRHFLAEQSTATSPAKKVDAPTATPRPIPDTAIPTSRASEPSRGSSDSTASWKMNPAVRIVPKGLRSFDTHDADFYLHLLPGPRDRRGLPNAIRFWKHRIEESDSDHTFSVGVIYGPSGCGKSSLVKAGLLPRLAEDVCAVYVEATAVTTESRLLHLIGKHTPDSEPNLGLREILAAVRRGRGIPSGKKLLIVIDQFEQWLHVHQDIESSELVGALRQCDGGRVQCIVMVRDEFWLAVSRFMQALELSLEDGQNSSLVDLFDEHHARNVLAAFGAAYGNLPEFEEQMSGEQKQFLKRAVAGLAKDGRVSCIRLALLADMMKSKQWTTDGLRHAGGTLGVGETFLEETFGASTAPLTHRYHEPAAHAVLKSLLPERGTDIKGQMKSREELFQASGYVSPDEFDELIKILDNELRLISVVDTDGIESENNVESSPLAGRIYYQLTHDYLVHSLWQWLSRKQKESRRGRAETRLAERSALWNARPEIRQLPSWWEYLNIQLFTRSDQWSKQERKLLTSAGRYHLVHKGGLMVLSIAIGIGTWQSLNSIHARRVQVEEKLQEQAAINRSVALVQQLRDADMGSVAEIAGELESWRPWSDPVITEGFQQAAEGSSQKLRLAIALMAIDQAGVDYVAESLPDLNGEPFDVALQALQPHQDTACESLWRHLEVSQLDQRTLLSTAIALASFSPDDVRWNPLLPVVATQLIKEARSEQYIARLGTVAPRLVTPIRELYRNASLPEAQRRRAAMALCSILSVEQQIAYALPDILVEWILETNDADEFQSLLGALRPHSYGVQQKMRATLDESPQVVTQNRRMNAAAVLLRFGEPDNVWPLLRQSPDPSFRNRLIDRITQFGVAQQMLADQLAEQEDASVRQAMILILGGSKQQLAADKRHGIAEQLEQFYLNDPDAGVHSAVNWTLRSWRMETKLVELDDKLSRQYDQDFGGRRDWTVNSLGQT